MACLSDRNKRYTANTKLCVLFLFHDIFNNIRLKFFEWDRLQNMLRIERIKKLSYNVSQILYHILISRLDLYNNTYSTLL